jgi:hypothetical protein
MNKRICINKNKNNIKITIYTQKRFFLFNVYLYMLFCLDCCRYISYIKFSLIIKINSCCFYGLFFGFLQTVFS